MITCITIATKIIMRTTIINKWEMRFAIHKYIKKKKELENNNNINKWERKRVKFNN